MHKLQLALVAMGAIATNVAALPQNLPASKELPAFQRPELAPLASSWRAQHGPSWHVRPSHQLGTAELIFGGSAEGPLQPDTDEQWIAQARHFLLESAPMTAVPSGQLVAERVAFLPLGLAGSTDKLAVHFEQQVDGVPVEDAHVSVIMDLEGRMLALHNTAVPGLEQLSSVPAIGDSTGQRIAVEAFAALHGAPSEVRETELLVARVEGGRELARLAWRTEVLASTPGETPVGEALLVDALTGAVLERESVIHHFDVGGQVLSNATPGLAPDTGSNPETQQPMPYLRVSSSAGTTFTDVNGNFNFPGATGPLQITVDYFGSFNRVNNVAGGNYSATFTGQTGTGNSFVMNPNTPELVTAQANAYLHINTVRDFIRTTNPSDDTGDFQVLSNANLSQTCNAFFDGGSVNYYQSGSGCVNTAYSTVIAHEYGHWLNVLYSTGNGSDGMGEGNADMWAMYTFDGPVVGLGFCGSGCNIRTGLNNRQYCGDGNGGCHGGVHANGEVWMGAGWKVRRNLKNSNGNSAGSMIADALFMGWMNGFNQTQIDSVIELQWLALDDDDGNIDNGTPNFGDIDGAFREQGFPGYDLPFISFGNVTEVPDQNAAGPFPVSAAITAEVEPSIASATLFWREVPGSFFSVAMTQGAGNVWSGDIPSQSLPTAVEYYIAATDSGGNTDTYPAGGSGDALGFGLGTPVEVAVFDFEAATNQGWTSGAPGDGATTGLWTRADPIATAAQPGDDVSNPGTICWFTGQGSPGGSLGENDVDSGATTLLSPIFDATELGGASVSYWRWFSNNTGASPGQDVFRISLSGNGGSTWTLVDQAGPTGVDAGGGWYFERFFIEDVMTPTSTMQVRFVAEDAGNGSIVEAAVDEFRVVGFEGGCPTPTSYGTAKLNSQFALALLEPLGQPSATANNFSINVITLVANQGALLFSGGAPANVPFAGGFRLIDNPIVREELKLMDSIGAVNFQVDVDPSMVGLTRYYQVWYRDPQQQDGTGIGLSNGLEVIFCE